MKIYNKNYKFYLEDKKGNLEIEEHKLLSNQGEEFFDRAFEGEPEDKMTKFWVNTFKFCFSILATIEEKMPEIYKQYKIEMAVIVFASMMLMAKDFFNNFIEYEEDKKLK